MSLHTPEVPLRERLAYGLGTFLPTAVNATGGMVMFFYTDVMGLSAALMGMILLITRAGDAVWDIYVGRLLDRTRTRWGQARPYLLFGAAPMALGLVAVFTVPPWEGPARVAWAVAANILLMWSFSLVVIPQQSLLALMTDDANQRLRISAFNSALTFVFVIGAGAGFPMLKDALADGSPARGFQLAAMLIAAVGLALTWVCFAVVKERVRPAPVQRPDLRGDLHALWQSRTWRVLVLTIGGQAAVISLIVGPGIYFFNVVLKQPAMIGPFMGVAGAGLVAGVLLGDRLTRIYCKKRVFVGSQVAAGLLLLGFLGGTSLSLAGALVLVGAVNLMLGIGAPILGSMNADVADHVELTSQRRIVGTLFATSNFISKVAAALASAVIGAVLTLSHYAPGGAAQPPEAVLGITLMMGILPAALALGLALLLALAYPLNKAGLETLREELALRRAAANAGIERTC